MKSALLPHSRIHIYCILFYFPTECDEYFVGLLVLAVILFSLLIILAYSVYQIHLLKSFKKNSEGSGERNDSDDIWENADNDKYEEVENEQSIYTALKKSEERDNDDENDHAYTCLTDIREDFVGQWESSV